MLQTIILRHAVVASAFVFSAVAQAGSIPTDAQLTRNAAGEIIGVRISGRSNLERRSLDAETIAGLAELTNLEHLYLWGTTVGDADIQKLSTLTKLQVIDLTFSDISGESLKVLAKFPSLVSIRLDGCDITDEQLEVLSDKTQLIELYLSKTKVTDAGLKHLRNMKKLILLDLSDCEITDSGLSSLGHFPQIRNLWLSKLTRYGDDDRSSLTDQCVDYLVTLKSLTDVKIADSKLTDAGIERLKQGLPNAKVGTERTGVTYLSRTKKDRTKP